MQKKGSDILRHLPKLGVCGYFQESYAAEKKGKEPMID